MSGLYQAVTRRLLFRVAGGDPEGAHRWTMRRLAAVSRHPVLLAALRRRFLVPAPRTVFGVHFPNPVGLAAGLDKDGAALPAWPALGFGFVEVGTVTAVAQPGNPLPRLFRLPASEALINRMGFNNDGAGALAGRLARLRPLGVPLGVSLGKSRVTPLADAVADYVESLRALRPYADFVTVNVSSPNTPGLRTLQDRDHLATLLAALRAEAAGLPILVKIAPDLTDQAICDLLQVCTDQRVAGLVATNTTLARTGVAAADAAVAAQTGGLSGRPLAERARAVVALVRRETAGALPVIGVGGILDPDDAVRMVDAGADLVQLYTGFIYRGPGLVRACVRAMG